MVDRQRMVDIVIDFCIFEVNQSNSSGSPCISDKLLTTSVTCVQYRAAVEYSGGISLAYH